MCGIFGFFGFKDHALLTKMAARLLHRGPDSEGFFTHGLFSMGMRRLSIIDLAGGEQPIFNEDKTVVVCFNGEIYNYLEIRKDLQKRGHFFQTQSDTEVIVHAYEEWSYDCLSRFNGMFAFALYDIPKKKLWIARDHSGQKPLYFFYKYPTFVFASEIKAILAAPCVPRHPRLAAIDAYLALRYVPEPATLFEDINTLPAAHFLVLDQEGKLSVKRYWDIQLLANQKDYLSPRQAYEAVQTQLQQSVKRVMRSDVPVGAYLSGGVDSSLLVALMRQHAEVDTYSIGFQSALDETEEARATAHLLGTQHHEIHCGPEDFNLLPKIIYHLDRPIGDALIIAFYKLAALASQDVKVVISGEGADEVFAGYPFHKVMQVFDWYFRHVPEFMHSKVFLRILNKIPQQVLNIFFSFPASLGQEGKKNLIDFLTHYRQRSLFTNYVALKTLWRPEERQKLYSPGFKHHVKQQWIPEVRDQSGLFLDNLLKLQWDEWLQDWAIIRQDKNTMAHSLEIRLPFLDPDLIELGFRIPPKLKATWFRDKIIQRRLACKFLPKAVTTRAKKPFYFPVKYFFEYPQFNKLIHLTLNKERILQRGYFDPQYIAQLLENMKTREFLYLKQVVSLVILELWHLIFIDNETDILSLSDF